MVAYVSLRDILVTCVHYYGVRYPGYITMRSLKALTKGFTVSRSLILTALQYYRYPRKNQDMKDLMRHFAGTISHFTYQSLKNLIWYLSR